MRLAFVHGINNQGNTKQEIEDSWWGTLEKTWADMGLPTKSKPPISTAYYADILADAADKGNDAIPMGATEASTGYALQFLKEYAEAAGVTQEELNAAADKAGISREAVAQGFPHEGWIIDFATLLEEILPDKGKFIAELFLRQSVVYINDKVLALKIDNKVKADIFDNLSDPTVVVAHSLGTVISYRLLANNQQATRNIPLIVTLGSPLSVQVFKPILPAKGQLPNPPIEKWCNGRDPKDFITLGRDINKDSIGFDGIENTTEIVPDPEGDCHSIKHYLASPFIAKIIYNQLF